MATRREELHAAMRLVYESYIRLGYIRPNRHRLHVIPHHVLPTTDVLVAVRQGEVIATTSVIMDSHYGLPMECLYHEEVEAFRAQGLRIAEVGCLADKLGGDSQTASCLFRLMSLVAQRSWRADTDLHLVVVHPRHAQFYERFLGFERFGDERPYGRVAGSPAVPLAVEVDRLPQCSPRAYQRLCGEPFPNESHNWAPIANDILSELDAVANETCPEGGFLRQLDRVCA